MESANRYQQIDNRGEASSICYLLLSPVLGVIRC